MALSAPNTAEDIVAALEAQRGSPFSGDDRTLIVNYWTTIIDKLYTRIKTDMVITSVVDPGIAVATAGSATNQTGATTAPGNATSSEIS